MSSGRYVPEQELRGLVEKLRATGIDDPSILNALAHVRGEMIGRRDYTWNDALDVAVSLRANGAGTGPILQQLAVTVGLLVKEIAQPEFEGRMLRQFVDKAREQVGRR